MEERDTNREIAERNLYVCLPLAFSSVLAEKNLMVFLGQTNAFISYMARRIFLFLEVSGFLFSTNNRGHFQDTSPDFLHRTGEVLE